MMPIGAELRIKHLQDNVNKDYKLLKEYEDALHFEDDPRRKLKYQREIELLRESAEHYQQEYEDLKRLTAIEPPPDKLKTECELQEIKSKLVELQSELSALRQDLIARFDAGERTIVATVINELNQSQLEMTTNVINAMEADRIQENDLKEAISAVQKVIIELLKEPRRHDPKMISEATSLYKALDDPKLDLAHKLKLSVPIIPFILEYEGQVELKGRLNLKSVWQTLKDKAQSR